MFPVRFVVFQLVQLQLRDGFRQEVVFDLLMPDVIAAGVQYGNAAMRGVPRLQCRSRYGFHR